MEESQSEREIIVSHSVLFLSYSLVFSTALSQTKVFNQDRSVPNLNIFSCFWYFLLKENMFDHFPFQKSWMTFWFQLCREISVLAFLNLVGYPKKSCLELITRYKPCKQERVKTMGREEENQSLKWKRKKKKKLT